MKPLITLLLALAITITSFAFAENATALSCIAPSLENSLAWLNNENNYEGRRPIVFQGKIVDELEFGGNKSTKVEVTKAISGSVSNSIWINYISMKEWGFGCSNPGEIDKDYIFEVNKSNDGLEYYGRSVYDLETTYDQNLEIIDYYQSNVTGNIRDEIVTSTDLDVQLYSLTNRIKSKASELIFRALVLLKQII